MVLSKQDLLEAEQQGALRIENRLEFSVFSLNLRLGTLFKANDHKLIQLKHELNQEQFMHEVLEELNIDNEFVTDGSTRYFWQPQEHCYVGPTLAGEIVSRSSWARLAVRVQSKSIDEDLHLFYREVDRRPLCTLHTTGTNVVIKRGDEIGQLILGHCSTLPYAFVGEMQQLLDCGRLEVFRDGQQLRAGDLNWYGGAALTMGRDLKIYRGTNLRPGKLRPEDFEDVVLPEKGIVLPKGTFFLSASAEEVRIPEEYVGYVTERTSNKYVELLWNANNDSALRHLLPMPFMSHANAPYVGPKSVFTGRVTFENYMVWDDVIRPGMLQSELLLKPLLTPIYSEEKSRYYAQNGATASRL